MGLIEVSKQLNAEYNEKMDEWYNNMMQIKDLIKQRDALFKEREDLMMHQMSIEDHRRYFQIIDEIKEINDKIKPLYNYFMGEESK